jgi:hypothetical protein
MASTEKLDPTLAQQLAEHEEDTTPSAITPEHKRSYYQCRAQQMQATEPEGDLFMQWGDGRSYN